MFFPYHLVGSDEVETFFRGWVESLAVATSPDGAPDFMDLPGRVLFVRPFDVLWASEVTLRVGMTVDVAPDRPAEPLWLAANLTRKGVVAWRYCRNENHPETGRDHLHLSGGTKLVGLPDPLTLDQLSARLLDEPR